jgi:lipopolysaccharide export system protein LptA
MTRKTIAGWALCLLPMVSWGQGKSQIRILNADVASLATRAGQKVNVLKGNVRYEHQGALLSCDSSWLSNQSTRLVAFSNVSIVQGDSLRMYADRMDYDGKSRILDAIGNVRLNDSRMRLTTDRIRLDRNTRQAYYGNGGTIQTREDHLVSKVGVYYLESKTFRFSRDVVLTNPRYSVNSDTMFFNTENSWARFYGPTVISGSQSRLETVRGWYNTVTDEARFSKSPNIYRKKQHLTGDSIFYNNRTGAGEVFKNVHITDTAENFIISGQYARYRDEPLYAFVTGKPMYTLLIDQDSLFIASDTILGTEDPANTQKMIRFYHHVRLYKSDFQAICDSLVYADRDSAFHLFRDPVVWNEETQITADSMLISTRNRQLDSLKMKGNCFILSLEEGDRYNQIKGRYIRGDFKDNRLNRMKVIGNAQTVYYVREEDGSYTGFNRADCSSLLLYLKDGKLSRVSYLGQPDATLYPMDQMPGNQSHLPGFWARFAERPTGKDDLYRRATKSAREEPPKP